MNEQTTDSEFDPPSELDARLFEGMPYSIMLEKIDLAARQLPIILRFDKDISEKNLNDKNLRDKSRGVYFWSEKKLAQISELAPDLDWVTRARGQIGTDEAASPLSIRNGLVEERKVGPLRPEVLRFLQLLALKRITGRDVLDEEREERKEEIESMKNSVLGRVSVLLGWKQKKSS